MRRLIALILSFSSFTLIAQTANDTVPTYDGVYRYGSNTSGRTGDWEDVHMADIAAGNQAVGQTGVGVRSFRTALPAHFLETWGYSIRVSEFNHYASLGMADHTVFMEDPPAAWEDTTEYCIGIRSDLFDNLYAPIWDGGTNGTPYNDTNYYAAYVYQLVDTYKGYVKFWEVMNEPDFTSTSNGWQASGVPGNWWDNPPDPCDLDNMHAPIFHYVRMLRISYEIIKSLDPTAFVATGGLGYPSFLDAILRYTDNPGLGDGGVGIAGSVQADYPLKGGAYFDCMSYHSYPQYAGRVNGTPKQRHSDAAAWGDVDKKGDFETVLHSYGYDGGTLPEKVYIITETNIPRAKFGNFIGGNEVQRNYIIKSAIRCQMNNIRQMYVFSLDDRTSEANAVWTHDLMGLFQDLGDTPSLYTQVANDIAIANHTVSDLLFDYTFDATQTALLNLPAGVAGAAFVANNGDYVYALWAETNIDESEVANATYSFPPGLGIASLERFNWNYSQTNTSTNISAANIPLTATPSFLISNNGAILPLAWSEIEAHLIAHDHVRIQWGLTGEILNGHFFVERSRNGVTFKEIYATNTYETAVDVPKYTFDDYKPLFGTNFYRIHYKDISGQVVLSPIVSIKTSKMDVLIGPSPLKISSGKQLNVYINGEGVVVGQIIDITGKQLLTFRKNVNTANPYINLEVSSFRKGIYLLNLRLGDTSSIHKFVLVN